MDEERPMTVREAGRLGGLARKNQQPDYSAMGQIGGAVTKARHGFAHYADIGHEGGKATAAKYGRKHFQAMGSKGGSKAAELIRKGQAAGE